MGIQTDIGADIGIRWTGLPSNPGASTITGSAVDRLGALSAVIAHACGAATGTPSSFTLATTLHHSDVSGSGFTASGISLTTLTADSTSAYADVNLSPIKQWLKLVTVVTFVAGTTPKIPVAATITLGGSTSGGIA